MRGFKKVMERFFRFVILILLLIFSGSVFGQWEGFDSSNDSRSNLQNNSGSASLDNEKSNLGAGITGREDVGKDSGSGMAIKNYTSSFYFALIALAVLIVVVMAFFYLFFKRPKNLWEKKGKERGKGVKKHVVSRWVRRPIGRRSSVARLRRLR